MRSGLATKLRLKLLQNLLLMTGQALKHCFGTERHIDAMAQLATAVIWRQKC
jgi:hypothetical protein